MTAAEVELIENGSATRLTNNVFFKLLFMGWEILKLTLKIKNIYDGKPASFPAGFLVDFRAPSSITSQIVELLREAMVKNRWGRELPGRSSLAKELGCSHWTIDEAVKRLEKEGLLVPQGAGRRRRINLKMGSTKAAALRVQIMAYERSDLRAGYMLELLYLLREKGHDASFASKTLRDLGGNLERVSRFARSKNTDAWILASSSREILEWFASQATPSFALFGRLTSVPVPGVALEKGPALLELIDRLLELGHKRIVMLTREERRKPTLGRLENLFLGRLGERGIQTGDYNLPDWGNDPLELRSALDSLFLLTPPTALIVDEPALCVAVFQYLYRSHDSLGKEGMISLACLDASEVFDWCSPPVTHLTWDRRPIVKRVVKWVEHIGFGQDDQRKSFCKARLFLGGTIGPVSK